MTPRQATPPRAQPSRQAKPLTAPAVRARKGSGPPLVMVTAYDAPGARIADEAGVDIILVGDSVAMVVLGYDDTLQVTVDDMAHHVAAVMHFAGRQQRGRDAYLAIVAANRVAFPDLVSTVDQMVADGDTVAIRYTMTRTHRGSFAGIAPTNRTAPMAAILLMRRAPRCRAFQIAPGRMP